MKKLILAPFQAIVVSVALFLAAVIFLAGVAKGNCSTLRRD